MVSDWSTLRHLPLGHKLELEWKLPVPQNLFSQRKYALNGKEWLIQSEIKKVDVAKSSITGCMCVVSA